MCYLPVRVYTMAYIELEFTLHGEYIAEYFLHKSLEVRSIHV